MRQEAMAVITTQAGPPGTRPQRVSGWRSRLSRLDTKVSPYLFVAPFFILFAIFGIYPLIWTLWVSVHKTEFITADKMGPFVGFANFNYILHDSFFWNALANTVTLGLLSAVPQLIAALGLAHILNYRLRGSTFWRVSMLAPYATSVAAATVVFAQLFNRDVGVVNYVLHTLFGIDNINFQQDKWPAQIAIATIVMWRWTGYNTLIYLAGMRAIPRDLYEAAEVDGASQWRQFRSVTIPSLRPTILFTIVISTIGSIQLFGEPLLFSAGGTQGILGGASRQYQTLAMYFYERGIRLGHLGSAAAVAWAMFLITIIFVVINTIVTRRVGSSEE
jgi:cellobiose transport system permease protein